ncbi:MAG: TonB-dependent receptor [Bacteroidota bacterium]
MRLILLISFSLTVNFLFAQTKPAKKLDCDCFIQGKVLDQHTKEPLVGAVILIKELGKGATTDSKGIYKIANICEGKYTVSGRIVGYEQLDYQINLEHGAEQNFGLSESEMHLENVDIRAKKIENLTQPKSYLDTKDLDKSAGNTLGETLSQLTGINTLQTGSSIVKPVIHGLHSSRVLIMNNGIRQEGQQWGNDHAPEIDPFEAKKITVIKGAAGVRYGADAIAGIISLEANPLPDSTQFGGEWNNIYFANGRQMVSSMRLEKGKKLIGNRGVLGVRMQGTIKRGGDISTPNYRLSNTGVSELNYSFTGGYRNKVWDSNVYFSSFNTQIGVFAGAHIGNVTDLTAALQRGDPLPIYTPENFSYSIDRPFQEVVHYLFKISNIFRFRSGNLGLIVGRQYNFRKEIDVLRGNRNLSQNFKLNTTNFELIFEHKPLVKLLSGSVGINGIFQENLTTGTISKPVSASVLIPNYRNLNFGIFLIERIVKNNWELEAGGRYDIRDLEVYRIPRGEQLAQYQSIKNENLTGTVGLNFRPNTRLNFLFSLSTARRSPHVNELFSDGVHHGAASFEKGDESLSPEKALNSSFTITYVSKKWQTEAHFYSNYIHDFIFLSPTGRAVLTIRGAFPEFWYTQTNAQFMGFDFNSIIQVAKHFSLQSKMSYLNARDLVHDQPLIMIPPNRIENTVKYERNEMFISLSNNLIARQNKVPKKLIFEEIPDEEVIFKDFGGDFAAPPNSYNLWNASAGNQFKIKNKNLAISLTINNIANTPYRDYMNRFRYFSDDIGRNFIIRTKLDF